jgi:hypothetical protein
MNKKTKKITLDGLAAMVADGFSEITGKMATKDDIANMATKDDIARLEGRINHIEIGQEDIKLRLDSVAYRFELTDLKKRVEKLEEKSDIRSK